MHRRKPTSGPTRIPAIKRHQSAPLSPGHASSMFLHRWRGQREQERAGKKGTPEHRGGEQSTERNQTRHDVCSTRRCQRATVDTACRAFTLFRPARELGCGSHRVGGTRLHVPAMVCHVLWSARWHHVTQEIEDRTGLASSHQPFQCCQLLGHHSRFWKLSRPHLEELFDPGGFHRLVRFHQFLATLLTRSHADAGS